MKNKQLLSPSYFDAYQKTQPITLLKHFDKIKKNDFNFGYAIESSAVYSSMIEGNTMDFDSYLKNLHSGMDKKNKSFLEIEDLKSGYLFAQNNTITLSNILIVHKQASLHLIENKNYVGKVRDKEVFIFSNGKKIYTGANPEVIVEEFEKLIEEIIFLVQQEQTIDEVFYYASYIHLLIAQIHPFADGNGRMARLVEKWFLSQKLGVKAWHIQSEKMYQKNLKKYYTNINMGDSYNTINYNLINPFLQMLPVALRTK
jgi:Fic family protein